MEELAHLVDESLDILVEAQAVQQHFLLRTASHIPPTKARKTGVRDSRYLIAREARRGRTHLMTSATVGCTSRLLPLWKKATMR